MKKMKIAVVGASTYGLHVAKLLSGYAHVTLIARNIPKEHYVDKNFSGVSSHDLGLGNFNKYVEWSNNALTSSYRGWMKELENEFMKGQIRRTRIHQKVSAAGGSPSWLDVVQNLEWQDDETVSYDTFVLNPEGINSKLLVDTGCRTIEKSLSDEQVVQISSGQGLEGYDHTSVALSGSVRTVRPDLLIKNKYELFVYLPFTRGVDSYVDEVKQLYVAAQPGKLVLNTFLTDLEVEELGVKDVPLELNLGSAFAQNKFNQLPYGLVSKSLGLVKDVSENFGVDLDASRVTHIIVNGRPCVDGPPKQLIEENCSFLVGSERKAAKTARHIAEDFCLQVCEKLEISKFAEEVRRKNEEQKVPA